MSDLDTPMIFRELTGQRRVVRLVERAKPYRGVGFGVKQRVKVTWLPGSPVAVHTVLGSELAPTTFTGKWKTKYLDNVNGGAVAFSVNNRHVRTAEEAVRIMQSMCAEGQVVEFTWGTEQRTGHIETFDWRYDNRKDIEWDLTCEWINTGIAQPPPVLSEDASLTTIVPALQRRTSSLARAASSPPTSVDVAVLSEAQTLTTRMDSLAREAFDTIALGATAALMPLEVSRRGAALLGGIAGQASTLVDLIETSPATSIADTSLSIGQLAALDAWRWLLSSESSALRRTCASQQEALVEGSEDDLIAVHTAREGEDLRDVSFRYYETRDAWRALMQYNALRSSALRVGQIIYVPSLSGVSRLGTWRRGGSS